MFKKVVLCETGGYNEKYVKDIQYREYRDMLNNYKYPVELVGGKFQVKPYFDFDLEIEENDDFDEEMKIMDYQQSLQLLFNLTSEKDIYYTHRKYTKDHKTKYSYHFVIDKIRISWSNLRILITNEGLDTRYPNSELDMSVYSKNRGMYPIYSNRKRPPKGEEEKEFPIFLPNKKDDDITKYLISYIEEDFEDYDLKFPKIEPKKKVQDNSITKLFDYKNDAELSLVSKLVLECLSYSRADNYDDWIKLGWCLHNIDDRLLDLWIEFSKISDKFEDGTCEEIWGKSQKRNLTIGSLKFWCKSDNINKYEEIMLQQIEPVIDKSIRSEGAHCDVAEVISVYMKDKIVYDTKVKSWFIVDDKTNIWVQDKEGVKVRKILSTHGCNLYMKRAMYWNTIQMNDDEKNEEVQKLKAERAKVAINIGAKLKNAGFKDCILKELKSWCVQDNFIEEYLDCNINLFAFKNGVYDLEEKKFRNIQPTDYISTTTNYDFNPNIDDSYINVIENFLKNTQKTDEMYKYLLDVITSMIYGKNYHQEFYIFNGKGANGKSVLMSLLSLVFGGYANKINATTFTKPSRAANETSEMHSCKSSRLLMVEEPEETDTLIASRLKEYSGDGKVKTRGLQENAFSFDPQFGIIFFCNQIPALSKVDNAIGRRLRLLDFPFKFCDNPTKSNEKLIDRNLNTLFKDNIEYRQAFAYIILENWKNNKLNQEKLYTPIEVMRVTENYMDDCNEVKKFINEHYDITNDESDRQSSSELFRLFKNNTNSKMDAKSFAYNMEEMGLQKKKFNYGNMWLCLKSKDDEDEDC